MTCVPKYGHKIHLSRADSAMAKASEPSHNEYVNLRERMRSHVLMSPAHRFIATAVKMFIGHEIEGLFPD